MELVEKKRKLVENFGYRICEEDGMWIAYEPSLKRGRFYHESPDYEATVEVAFLLVAGYIMHGLIDDTLSVEEAGKFFKDTDVPEPEPLTSRK